MRITHYTDKHLEQFALQRLAKDILDNGSVEKVTYHAATVIDPDGTSETYNTGSKCIEVTWNWFRFWIHVNGARVTEIIEGEGFRS